MTKAVPSRAAAKPAAATAKKSEAKAKVFLVYGKRIAQKQSFTESWDKFVDTCATDDAIEVKPSGVTSFDLRKSKGDTVASRLQHVESLLKDMARTQRGIEIRHTPVVSFADEMLASLNAQAAELPDVEITQELADAVLSDED